MRTSGFTIIELLVVISIISLLTSVILAGLNETKINATKSRLVQEMISIRTASEIYKNDNKVYPTTIVQLVPTYMKTTPVNPYATGIQFLLGTETNATTFSCGSDIDNGRLFVWTVINVSGIPITLAPG